MTNGRYVGHGLQAVPLTTRRGAPGRQIRVKLRQPLRTMRIGGAHEIACESETRFVGRGGRTGGLVQLGQRPAADWRHCRDRRRRHRRRRDERERSGGRRVGDRGNNGPADEVRQDGRHRRSGALRPAGSAVSELPGVRARLRVGGFGAHRRQTRTAPGSQSGRRARRTRGCAGVSGQLLAEPPRDPQGRSVRQGRPARNQGVLLVPSSR